MRFRDLGSLLIDDGGMERPVGSGRIGSVLAMLVANAGTVVGPEPLIDAVWGQAVPERAAQSLETIIWRLRKMVEPGRAPREAATVIRREDHGYRLAVDADDVDSWSFEQASIDIAARLEAGATAEALELADAALRLWRGRPFEGVSESDWMTPFRARLEERHLDVHQHRLAALLDSDHPERAATDAAALLAEHPFRERLWELRMLGLYRCGRQVDALGAFAEVRQLLVTELGVEPGGALQDLHRRMLAQDISLQGPPDADRAAAGGEIHLPARHSELIGRAQELAAVRRLIGANGLTTITGAGGCGKTRLAVEAASHERASFPDGVWFIDLASAGETMDAAGLTAGGLGLAPRAGATVQEALVGFLASRRALLILDNCEHMVDPISMLVQQLRISCPLLSILATSREPLLADGERVWELAPLDVTAAAAQLFLARVVSVRPGYQADAADLESIRRICVAVGGLPLGIELAAAHARSFELRQIAQALERAPGDLTRLGGGPLRHVSLDETVEWSLRLARPDERLLHRRLAVLPGPFSFEAAANLCALPPLRVEQSLGLVSGLVHRSLLTAERSGSDQHFVQLVPVRAHARAALTAAAEGPMAQEACNRWVLDQIITAPDDGRVGQDAWFDWLDENVTAVESTLQSVLIDAPDPSATRLLGHLASYWLQRDQLINGLRWLEIGRDVTIARDNDYDFAVRQCLYGCAVAYNQETDLALSYLMPHVATISDPPPSHGEEAANVLLLMSASIWVADDWATADDLSRQVGLLAARLGLSHVSIRAKAVRAASLIAGGDLVAAAAAADDVLSANASLNNSFAAFFAYVTKGIAAVASGDWRAGLSWTSQSLLCQSALGMRNIGDTLEQRGAHHANGGQTGEAVRCYAASSTQHRRAGRRWPRHPGTAERLVTLREQLPDAEFDRWWSSGQRLAAEPAALARAWM
ncbi:MAG TPA: BTAD domain-containing putative transcriptional regulator [Frankiaceae bacterium]|nr:BTAD domain-containing putative transcriptional regulator [Frankiaceae bacterium]